MTFIPGAPFVPHGRPEPAGPPDWLKLEPGEVFVRAYGADSAQQRKRVIMVIIGLLVAAQLGLVFFFGLQSGDLVQLSNPKIPLALILLLIALGFVVLTVVSARKRGAQGIEAVLTSKMLVMKSGKSIAGINLSDIARIERRSDSSKKVVVIYITGQARPVAALPVPDLDAAIAEFAAYSAAAGAKLS